MTLSKYGRRWPFLSTSQKYGLRSSRMDCAGLYSLRRNGPQPTMVFRIPIHAVGRGERFVGDGFGKDMFRQNRHTAEIFLKRRVNFRSHHLDCEVVQLGDSEFFAINDKEIARDVVNFRVVYDVVPGEHHVVRREWFAVAPAQIFPQTGMSTSCHPANGSTIPPVPVRSAATASRSRADWQRGDEKFLRTTVRWP